MSKSGARTRGKRMPPRSNWSLATGDAFSSALSIVADARRTTPCAAVKSNLIFNAHRLGDIGESAVAAIRQQPCTRQRPLDEIICLTPQQRLDNSINNGLVHCEIAVERACSTTYIHGTRVPGGGAVHRTKSGLGRSAAATLLNIDLRIRPML